jgi:sulfonate transport system substrate-binding protein
MTYTGALPHRRHVLAGTAATVATLCVPAIVTRADELLNVDIGTIQWPGSVPIYVAMATGATDRNGITIGRNIVASGATRRAALLAGEIQFCDFAFSNDAVSAEKHVPFKIVSSTYDYEAFSLLVRAPLKDKIKTVADLKGMAIGFDTPGAGPWGWTRIFLSGSGLDPDKDVKLVGAIAHAGVIVAALSHARIDAYATYEPVTSFALVDKVAYPLVSIWEPEAQKKWVGATALGSALTTTSKVIKEKPELVKRFVATQHDGLRYINSHTPEQIADLLQTNALTKEIWGHVKREALVLMLNHCKPGFAVTDGRVSRSGYENEVKAYRLGGVVKSDIPFENLVDTSFAGEKA